jgi:hypothetical protein
MPETNRFVVHLGELKLRDRQERRFEEAIQSAVLTELARIDFQGDFVARFPREWLGIWIDVQGGLRFDDKLAQEFAPRAG